MNLRLYVAYLCDMFYFEYRYRGVDRLLVIVAACDFTFASMIATMIAARLATEITLFDVNGNPQSCELAFVILLFIFLMKCIFTNEYSADSSFQSFQRCLPISMFCRYREQLYVALLCLLSSTNCMNSV